MYVSFWFPVISVMFRTSQLTSESLTDPAGYFWGLSRLLTFLSFLVLASTSCCREVNVSLSSRVSSSWAIICCWISLSLRVWKQFGVNSAIQANWWGRLRLLCFLFIARYRCNRSMKVLLVRRRCGKKTGLPAQQSLSSSSPTSSAVHWCGRWCSFRQPTACSPSPDKTKGEWIVFFKKKNMTFLYQQQPS